MCIKMTVIAKEVQGKFQWKNTLHQYYGTLCADLIVLVYGLIIGWLSPATLILTSSDNTPLTTGPLTNEQLSWLGSCSSVGGVTGTFIYGYITSIMGCKRAIGLVSIPCIAFWLLIYFGTKFYLLVVACFLSGLAAGGLQVALILYVSEIANDDNRGTLGSFAIFMRNIGVLCGYVLGASVEYNTVPLICIFVPIIFAVVFTLLPNTAQFYLRNGHIKKAEHALKYYKGYQGNSEQEDKALYEELEKLKSIASEQKEAKFKISYLCNRAAMKGLGVGVAMSVFSQISCCFTIISYAALVFKKTETSFDPNLSSIVLAVAVLLGSLGTTYFADKLGRKKLNFISMTGSAAGLLSLSLYHYLHLSGYDLSAFSLVPVICLSFVCFIASAGIVPLTVVCSIEYMPTKIRTFGMTFTAFVINVVCFASTKIFPILLENYDLHRCMMIYGFGSLASAIFILVVMTETNGRSLDDVGADE